MSKYVLVPQKFPKNSQKIQEIPKNSRDFEKVQFSTSHLETENPFRLVILMYNQVFSEHLKKWNLP